MCVRLARSDLVSNDVGAVEATLHKVIADTELVQKHVERLVAGTSVANILQDDGCILLEASRPGIAMKIIERKLHRPVRHGVLAEWTFIPIDAKIVGNGRYDQLLLGQDYLRLRSSSGRMCYCPAAAGCRPTTVDYTMLLRDVTVIEMGTELVTWTVLLPIIWSVLLPLLWVMYWHGESSNHTVTYMNYVFGLLALVCAGISSLAFFDDSSEGRNITAWAFAFLTVVYLFPTFLVKEMSLQHVAILGTFLLSYLPGIFFFGIYETRKWILSALPPVWFVLLMTLARANLSRCLLYSVVIYALGLSISVFRGWTRRPYVYFGVLVGSTSRASAVYGLSASPFWVRMARGTTTVRLTEVVDSVRNAAKMSLQQDLAHAKKGASTLREREFVFNPVCDSVAAVNMSAAQVLVDHTVSEMGGAVLLMAMEGAPFLITTLTNAAAVLAVFTVTYLEIGTRESEGLFGVLAVWLGFDGAKVIAIPVCSD